jgi:hypothetical protein
MIMNCMNILKTGAVVLMLSTACTYQFDSVNTDPNYPTTATVDLLLNPLLRSIAQNQFNYNNGSGLAHYLARTNYNEVEQYAFGANEGTWSAYYLHLSNIHEMIRAAERDDRPSCKAVAYILKAFSGAQLTDLWGDVPFFEAALGADHITPSYDRQQDIYTAEDGVIALLKKAEDTLSGSNDVLPPDIVYNGNRLKWRKLGNSLRLRYLMRISNRRSDITAFRVEDEIRTAMQLPLMDTNDDNMLLKYLSGNPNRCPVYDMRAGEFEYIRMSDEMDEMLNRYSDPRMAVWFAPSTHSASAGEPAYRGIPAGCSSTTLTQIGYSQADVSMLGDYYRATPDACSAVLMNCSEVKFLQAEAIVRGYAVGDARTLYEEGIKLSMDYYGVEIPSRYLTQDGVSYTEATALEQIMQQKWLSLFMVGYEAWFDFLRTGLPRQNVLLDNRNPSDPGGIPSRFYYPESEQAVNGANYREALERQGGNDDINTKLWWE